jgi:putative tryptophan/tyrosine transport system substrate-binding protein
MKRREFITLLGGTAAVALPLAARAQQKIPRIGILVFTETEHMGPFREALRDLGYIDGRNIQFEIRAAEGQVNRLPDLAAELVRSKVDIIVASLTPAVTAASKATSDIPIVMAPAGDPVATGLITSLARPGGNITGVSATAAELSSKNLELVRDILPSARNIAVLHNPNDPFASVRLEQLQQGAKGLRLDIRPVTARSNDEMFDAFASMALERPDAVILPGNLPTHPMIDLALQHRLPTFSTQKPLTHGGALASYSASFPEMAREIAGYVDKILKGTKPTELPVQQPSKFELAINLKTAKALGLEVPPTLLARADEVIE